MTTFLASIFVFGLLIFFHELGHFAIAKLVGIRVHEFSLGFGPKLAGVKKGETVYTLRVLPLGGFVRMAGMDPGEKNDDHNDTRGFNRKTVGQRTIVIAAGPLMNFFLAIVLLAVIFTFQGVPIATTSIMETVPGFPAEEAGLAPGDKILSVDGQSVENWEQLTALINSKPEQDLEIAVARDGTILHFIVRSIVTEDGAGKIGIAPEPGFQRVGFLKSLILGLEWTVRITILIIGFIIQMIAGQAPADLFGPVGIVNEIGRAAQVGFFFLLQLAAFLSINLGLFNLLPIPALDGSRIIFLVWEKIRGKPVDPMKEGLIHFIGFGLLLVLIMVITYKDILRLF